MQADGGRVEPGMSTRPSFSQSQRRRGNNRLRAMTLEEFARLGRRNMMMGRAVETRDCLLNLMEKISGGNSPGRDAEHAEHKDIVNINKAVR